MAKKKTQAATAMEPEEATAGPAVQEAEPHDEAGSGGEAEENIKDALKKVLDVKAEDAGVLRKQLTITIPAEAIRAERDKQYSELIQDAIVPGFRRGRAPRRLVEKRFGHEIGDQVQTKLVTNAFLAATEMKELKVLGDPLVWSKADGKEETLVDVGTALRKMKLPDDGPLTYRCEVEIWPEFTLPDLQRIKVKKPRVRITDDDVTKQIDRMRSNRGTWEPLPDGTVEPHDLLIVNFDMTVGNETIKSEENVQIFARAQRVEGVTLEKLGDVLKGAKVGATKTLEGTMPDDYERADLRGKTTKMSFELLEIKRFRLPPLDAAFLEASGFESEAELRDFVRQRMQTGLEQAVRRGMRGQVSRHLLTATKLQLPERMSRRHVDRAIIRRMVELRRNGVPMEEIQKHTDELRTKTSQEAQEGLALQFILEKIAEQRSVEVGEEEINTQIASIARHYNRRFDRVRDELAQGDGLSALYMDLRDEKCLDKLLEDAEIEETEGPPESISEASEATRTP